MWRKFFIGLLVLAILGGLGYFFYFGVPSNPSGLARSFRAVPSNAALILEGRNLAQTWKKVSEKNQIWESLKQTPTFQELHQNLDLLDLMLHSDTILERTISTGNLLVSAHPSGARSFHFLFVCEVNDAQQASLERIAKKLAGKVAISKKKYDGAVIFKAPTDDPKELFAYSFHEGLFIGSFSTLLVEQSIRLVNTGSSLLDDPSFLTVAATRGKTSELRLYLNPQNLSRVVLPFLPTNEDVSMTWLTRFAGWAETDLTLKADLLAGSGYAHAFDTLQPYLGLFHNQAPSDWTLQEVAPFNTAVMISQGIGEISTFQERLQQYREYHQSEITLPKLPAEVKDCDLPNWLNQWLGDQVALVITEPGRPELEEQSFALLRTEDPETTDTLLRTLSNCSGEQAASYRENYAGFTLGRWPKGQILSYLLGDAFRTVTGNFYARLGETVVVANSPQALRSFINYYSSEKVLSKDLDFVAFTDNLNSSAHLFGYANLARSPRILQSLLATEVAEDIENNLSVFREFQAIAWQISHDHDKLYYTNWCVKYNPIYREELPALWATALDTSVSRKPMLSINHFTRSREILVQDDANQLYLINNTGLVLWKKPLDGPILGKVHQVDLFQNSRLQLVFNTAKRLYRLDRNGKDLENSPTSLPDSATASVAIVDYDGRGKIRLLVPCGKRVINYDKQGEKVSGWKLAKAKAPVIEPVRFLRLSGKEYLFVADSSGQLRVVDRVGRKIKKLKHQLPPGGRPFYVHPGNEFAQCHVVTTDSTGNVIRIGMNNRVDTIATDRWSAAHHFLSFDLDQNGQPEWIFADSNRLAVFEADGKLRFEFRFEAVIEDMPAAYNFPNKGFHLGISIPETRQLYLFDPQGMIWPGLPLEGTTSFSIADINKDGSYNLVVGNADKKIYTFNLP